MSEQDRQVSVLEKIVLKKKGEVTQVSKRTSEKYRVCDCHTCEWWLGRQGRA